MTFIYHDHTYRIGFRHDKSRRWEDHPLVEVKKPHRITFLSRRLNKNKELIQTPATLWCETCHLQLSHLSKDQLRRDTHCTIWQQSGVDEAGRANWVPLAHGSGKLNLEAGDRYNREKGRVVALTAALASVTGLKGIYPHEHSFRSLAWAAFHGRRHGAQAKGA